MSLEGNLALLDLREIIRDLGVRGVTGILTIQGDEDIIAISFLKGEVVAADALNQSVEQGLGRLLLEEGLLQPADLERLAGEQRESGRRVQDLLVEQGLVSREQLLEGLQRHTARLVLEAMLWRHGEFKFYRGDEVSYEEGVRPIPVDELLALSLREPAWEEAEVGERLDPETVFEPVDAGPSAGGRLTEPERRLLALVDGQRSVGAILAVSELPEYRVLFLLYRLERAGLVRQVEPAGGTAGVFETGQTPETLETARRRRSLDPSRLRDWLAGVGAAAVAVAVLGVAASRLTAVLLPFSWQETERLGLERQQRAALYRRIDAAAKTFFLLEGRFPDRLEGLAEADLVATADLEDPAGWPIAYAAGDTSYILSPGVEQGAAEGAVHTAVVSGDPFRDPEFLIVWEPAETAPLVLLD